MTISVSSSRPEAEEKRSGERLQASCNYGKCCVCIARRATQRASAAAEIYPGNETADMFGGRVKSTSGTLIKTSDVVLGTGLHILILHVSCKYTS